MFSKRDVRKGLDTVQTRSRDIGGDIRDELQQAAGCSCTYLKNNPWAGVGLGAALGLVVGVLISKK
ncbi:hypothetical protein PMPD1_1880 [Paramixta manurensis]|uniref:DUF883 domain-containing protein n=1 Tax=Paramixta manurensis TaxID=2740817 RepID=A0A6M8UGL1_9GAMM|nr:hypothetical protein PMPD1_1880 [Erwiniaceae bacterium PD-1]